MSRHGGAAIAAVLVMAVTVIAACTQRAAETASRPAAPSQPATSRPAPPAAAPRPASGPRGGNSYRYANARFGFSFEVPDGFTAQAPPENGDGLTFRSPAGPATVTAYGQNNALGRTPGQELAAMASARQSAGDTVTYRFIRGDVIAVSGTTTTGTVFYRREVVYPAVMYALAWLYPTASRTRYDALVTETADSFVPGPGRSG